MTSKPDTLITNKYQRTITYSLRSIKNVAYLVQYKMSDTFYESEGVLDLNKKTDINL